MIKNIYLAGPLFSRGEIRDRINDEEILNSSFKKIKIFNPIRINQSVDLNKVENKDTYFFNEDIRAMDDADIAIVDLDNNDPGTIMELGYFVALKKNQIKDLKIFIIYSNWKGLDLVNRFVLGGALVVADGIYKDINEVVSAMKGLGYE